MNGTKLSITLDRTDLSRVLDELRMRTDAWQKTVEFVESGYIADDSFISEWCTDADEAKRVAEQYERIVKSIESQASA